MVGSERVYGEFKLLDFEVLGIWSAPEPRDPQAKNLMSLMTETSYETQICVKIERATTMSRERRRTATPHSQSARLRGGASMTTSRVRRRRTIQIV